MFYLLLLKNMYKLMIWNIFRKEEFVLSIVPGIEFRKPNNLGTSIKGMSLVIKKTSLCCCWKSCQFWKTLPTFMCISTCHCSLCSGLCSSSKIHNVEVRLVLRLLEIESFLASIRLMQDNSTDITSIENE